MSQLQGDSAVSLLEQRVAMVRQLKAQISSVLIGQDRVVDEVLISLLAAGHVLVEGVPGLGKTLLVRALAAAFQGEFSRIQFTPDLMPSDITGHVMFDNEANKFRIRRGPVFTHLLLADEINRAPAKTQSALLEVMQEHQVTLEGKALPVPDPFMVMATQNPIEQEGTYPLPEAQLDRFLMKIKIDYPQSGDEHDLVKAVTTDQVGDRFHIQNITSTVRPEEIVALQQFTATLPVDDAVSEYAVAIVRQTRDWPGISIGSGPRGGIALIRCARASALIQGRDFVTPADIKQVASAVLRHRVILSPEMELEGLNVDRVIVALLDKVEAPRQ